MNKFMQRLRDAIDRIEQANRLCPLTVDLGDREMLRLVELAADADMPVGQIVQLLERMNDGEVVFSLLDR